MEFPHVKFHHQLRPQHGMADTAGVTHHRGQGSGSAFGCHQPPVIGANRHREDFFRLGNFRIDAGDFFIQLRSLHLDLLLERRLILESLGVFLLDEFDLFLDGVDSLQNFQMNSWDSEIWNIADWTRAE